jgi:hypothetical protein
MADLRETAVDPMTGKPARPMTPPGYEPSFAENAIEGLLKLYGKYADRQTMPTNRRIFLETVVENARTPITEKDFAPAELDYMKSLIAKKYDPVKPFLQIYEDYLSRELTKDSQFRKQKKAKMALDKESKARYEKDLQAIKDFNDGKITPQFLDLTSPNQSFDRGYDLFYKMRLNKNSLSVPRSVTYKDYSDELALDKDRYATAGSTPKEAVHLTVGQFNYDIDPQTGQLVIKEDYDFNPPIDWVTNKALPAPPIGAETLVDAAPMLADDTGTVAYRLLRQYAGRKVPPGYGRPVNINLGTGLATSAVPPVFPTYGQ